MIPGIDVRGSMARGETSGSLSFSFGAEAALLDIPYTAFSSPVEAELRYEIRGDGSVEVTGTVAFSIAGACSRCLEETERRFEGPVFGVFVRGEAKDEEYSYAGASVSLAELLRDSVLFAIPARLLCPQCETITEERKEV